MWLCGCKAIFLSNNRDDEGMEDMKKETLLRVGSGSGPGHGSAPCLSVVVKF
jgi:hypothetical protein